MRSIFSHGILDQSQRHDQEPWSLLLASWPTSLAKVFQSSSVSKEFSWISCQCSLSSLGHQISWSACSETHKLYVELIALLICNRYLLTRASHKRRLGPPQPVLFLRDWVVPDSPSLFDVCNIQLIAKLRTFVPFLTTSSHKQTFGSSVLIYHQTFVLTLT